MTNHPSRSQPTNCPDDGKPSNVAISFSDPADAPEEARGGPGANPLIVGACDLLDLGMKNLRLENIEVSGWGSVGRRLR